MLGLLNLISLTMKEILALEEVLFENMSLVLNASLRFGSGAQGTGRRRRWREISQEKGHMEEADRRKGGASIKEAPRVISREKSLQPLQHLYSISCLPFPPTTSPGATFSLFTLCLVEK